MGTIVSEFERGKSLGGRGAQRGKSLGGRGVQRGKSPGGRGVQRGLERARRAVTSASTSPYDRYAYGGYIGRLHLIVGGEEDEDIVSADANADVDPREVEEGEEGKVKDENVHAVREDQREDHLQ